LKNYLNDVLQELITPIRERREMFEKNKDQVKKILLDGSKKAREIASETLKDVKKAMQIDYLDL
jgi:tryptophanyl-tRNA synthetase